MLRVVIKAGRNRVLRGGSWINNAQHCRCAYRNANDPGNDWHNNGFRLALAQSGLEHYFDQMTLLSRLAFMSWTGKKPGPWCVGSLRGCQSKTRQKTALFYGAVL